MKVIGGTFEFCGMQKKKKKSTRVSCETDFPKLATRDSNQSRKNYKNDLIRRTKTEWTYKISLTQTQFVQTFMRTYRHFLGAIIHFLFSRRYSLSPNKFSLFFLNSLWSYFAFLGENPSSSCSLRLFFLSLLCTVKLSLSTEFFNCQSPNVYHWRMTLLVWNIAAVESFS